jgi:hypothetical protein
MRTSIYILSIFLLIQVSVAWECAYSRSTWPRPFNHEIFPDIYKCVVAPSTNSILFYEPRSCAPPPHDGPPYDWCTMYWGEMSSSYDFAVYPHIPSRMGYTRCHNGDEGLWECLSHIRRNLFQEKHESLDDVILRLSEEREVVNAEVTGLLERLHPDWKGKKFSAEALVFRLHQLDAKQEYVKTSDNLIEDFDKQRRLRFLSGPEEIAAEK